MNARPEQDFSEDLTDLPVAASWATSVTEDLERSNQRAWIVAIIAAIIALLEAVALVFLVPLKTVEPYTLLVDRQTGNVEALAPLDAQVVNADAALTRSFLVQYVIARESFALPTLQDDYRKVSLWSDRSVRETYQRAMNASTPGSPLAVLPRGTSIRTQVKSVSNLGEGRALVRFQTTRIDQGAAPQPAEHWAAIVGYNFSRAEMSAEDRYINPLGFQVTSYRRDAETIPEEDIVNGVDQDDVRTGVP
jgi:Type IV secretory pathway, component VirB8